MKKMFVLMAFVGLSYQVNAVCFESFVVTGIGVNTQAAKTDAEARANEACGTDDFNWSSRRSDYSFEQISHEEFSATANFQCCSSW